MKQKCLSRFALYLILLSIIFIAVVALSFLKNNNYDYNDLTLTILTGRHYRSSYINYHLAEIQPGEKISGQFIATENNLGILAFNFMGSFGGLNNDEIIFRIKEKDKKEWYYENIYNTNYFQPDQYFPIGFPIIHNSQGKKYYFELELIKSKFGTPIYLSPHEPAFLSKYKFSREELLKNKNEIVILFFKKIFSRYTKHDLLVLFIFSLISLFIYKIYEMKKNKDNKKMPILNIIQKSNFISQLQILIILSLTLYIAVLFSRIGVDALHDGILLKPALDVAEGKILFRETFTQYGALTTLLQSFALQLFGKSLVVIRLLTAVIYSLTAIFLWLVWSRVLPRWLATLSCIIWIFIAPFMMWTFSPWSSVYSLFFQIFSLYILYIYIEKNKLIYLFICGILTAFTFWCRQPVGVFLFLSYILFIISLFIFKKKTNFVSSLKNIIIFSSGFLSVTIIFAIWLLYNSAFSDWWLQSIDLAYIFAKQEGQGFNLKNIVSSLLALHQNMLWFQLPIITILTLFIFIFKFLKKKILNLKDIKLMGLILVSLTSWLQYYPVSESWHFYWAATPMIGVSVYFVLALSNKLSGIITFRLINSFPTYIINKKQINILYYYLKLLFLFITLYIIYCSMLKMRIINGIRKLEENYIQITSPKILYGMLVPENEKIYYQKISSLIESYIKKNPQSSVITTTKDALYLTFAENNKNFHPFYVNWGFLTTSIYPDYNEKLNQYININHPLILSLPAETFDGYCKLEKENELNELSIQAPCGKIL